MRFVLFHFDSSQKARQLKFKQWNGKERSIYFEDDQFYCTPKELETKGWKISMQITHKRSHFVEHGGVAVARGRRVVKIDPEAHTAWLDDGKTIKYDKCLIATGLFMILSYKQTSMLCQAADRKQQLYSKRRHWKRSNEQRCSDRYEVVVRAFLLKSFFRFPTTMNWTRRCAIRVKSLSLAVAS